MLLMNSSCAQQEQASVKKEEQLWLQAKVIYLAFEGGFYGLVTENGTKLLPMNLAKDYKVHGTLLKIKGNTVEGLVSTRQWGILYKLSAVKLIKLGSQGAPNSY